jgi:hypothetical protein
MVKKMNQCNDVFLLANCFNNYEIVSAKVVEFYIGNALTARGCGTWAWKKNAQNRWTKKIKTFFEDTPAQLFLAEMYSTSVLGSKSSKLYQNFIIMLSLVSVCLARMENSITVYSDQGVVPIAGFSSIFTLANSLNLPTVYWKDDMRATWGAGGDPIVTASKRNFWKSMAVAPSVYSVGESASSISSVSFARNLNNDYIVPTQGTKVVCSGLNTFVDQLEDAIRSTDSSTAKCTVSEGCYVRKLIALGQKIIYRWENTRYYAGETYPVGGWGTSPELYFTLNDVVVKNTQLLSKEQADFVKTNNFEDCTSCIAIEAQPKTPQANKADFDAAFTVYLQQFSIGKLPQSKYNSDLVQRMSNRDNKNL